MKFLACAPLWVILAIIVGLFINTKANQYQNKDPSTKTEIVVDIDTPDDWQLFKQALIEVESGGDTNAVGKTGDFGILQITPIYVAEVNRIIGEQKYSHNDALDSLKSLEMFEVMQGKYNPIRSLKKALILHNPNAMNKHTMSYYEYKVMYNFYKLKSEWYESNRSGNVLDE